VANAADWVERALGALYLPSEQKGELPRFQADVRELGEAEWTGPGFARAPGRSGESTRFGPPR
jgi:hypothetical protein